MSAQDNHDEARPGVDVTISICGSAGDGANSAGQILNRAVALMGYHIMPNAVICLLASSLLGGRSIYQMTGGPIQIIGGEAAVAGYDAILSEASEPSLLFLRLKREEIVQAELAKEAQAAVPAAARAAHVPVLG